MKNRIKIPKFGHQCPECGKGTIKVKKFKNYKTKFWNVAFVVPSAFIGVCSSCKAKIFDAKERYRWIEGSEKERWQLYHIFLKKLKSLANLPIFWADKE
jgi:hypothetical protein